MPEYFPTKHAVAKMAAREVTWAQVLQVVAAPENTWSGSGGYHRNNSTVMQRGDLYVVVGNTPEYDKFDTAKEHPLVPIITVGLRQQDQWTDDDIRNRTRR